MVTRSHSRRLAVAGIAVTGAFALAACGNNNTTTSPGTSSASTSTSTSVGTSSSSSTACATGSLSGQGSTFQANAELQWISDYQKLCSGATVAYQGTGSGAGKTAFGNGTADFAGTDSLPKPAEQAAANKRCGTGSKGIITPIVAGAAVVTYNLSGVSNLTLTPAIVGGIFQKTITKWNDPAIAAANPGVTLPSTTIVPVHRSDSSGTTQIFTTWLDKTDPGWKLMDGQTVTWPSGELSGSGSSGVTTTVKENTGGITYTELSFATEKNLPVAKIVNQAGQAVSATSTSIAAALATATLDTSQGDLRVTPDYATTNPAAYPMSSPTFVFTCTTGNKNVALMKSYFTYALTTGQAVLPSLGYAPLPASLNTKALAQVATLS